MEKRNVVQPGNISVWVGDNSKAMCILCKTVISHGGVTSMTFTTSPLNNHLSYKHRVEYKQIVFQQSATNEKSAAGAKSSVKTNIQMMLSEMAAKKKTLEVNSAEANKIHIAIGKMMALDIQPYSIVEDVGFKSLVGLLEPRYIMPSRKYFSEKIISDMYITVRARVQLKIDKAKFIGLMTDTWTAQHSTELFTSLTAHWINENFARKYAVLQ